MDYHNPFSLEGKTVLVTGASSGIGRAIAIECSRLGAKVIATGRNEKRLSVTLDMLEGKDNMILTAELTNGGSLDNLISKLPMLDGIVHSAGISKRLPLKFIKEEDLENLHKINFVAPLLLTQKVYKNKLLSSEASLVFISSVAVNYASIGSIMYMSSKGALNSFVKGLAYEVSAMKIRANVIQPGMIDTDLSSILSDEDKLKDLANYPLGRYGKPEEVAFAAVYLLSDTAKWITGSILTIDGGLTLR
jgi:NAD(P)-dependent dehydrogenase (short-subunit alcohol dehydrogenase family)